jgi:hypothetical protein
VIPVWGGKRQASTAAKIIDPQFTHNASIAACACGTGPDCRASAVKNTSPITATPIAADTC